ncbi:hypothetical protein C2845_PM02G36450 [Panicum miliaceum]|uniref:WD repeat-containing protein RUP2-like n=1 Tax=Panicum miliaceum TaxID=4540 RepID=A0A3L6S8D3_PANMI|nr:hypothetical protein C2845_PM02G36450 [Panicum miliaceum]
METAWREYTKKTSVPLQAAAAQHQETTLQQHELAAGASEATGIISLPPAAAAADDKDDNAELSPPRCEWEFRLAATVPSTALPGASDAIGSVDFDPTGHLLATGGIARRIRMYDVASLLVDSGNDTSAGPGPAACICVPAKLSSVQWRPDAPSEVVGCSDYDGVVTEYDVERGVAAWERDEHAGRRVGLLDYAPGAAMAASGSDDRRRTCGTRAPRQRAGQPLARAAPCCAWSSTRWARRSWPSGRRTGARRTLIQVAAGAGSGR